MTDYSGWHFSDNTERLRYGDGRKIEVGIKHTVECQPVLCEVGLHASERVLDALRYAPGTILWRVTLSGTIVRSDDKACATERTYHQRLDATDILRTFARRCALDVIHMWNAPAVVREFLETGKGELRAAAWASRSVEAAAWSADSTAAWSARNSAWSAASANDAASKATHAANAAWSAARAFDETAEAARWTTIWAYQNKILTEMIEDVLTWGEEVHDR